MRIPASDSLNRRQRCEQRLWPPLLTSATGVWLADAEQPREAPSFSSDSRRSGWRRRVAKGRS